MGRVSLGQGEEGDSVRVHVQDRDLVLVLVLVEGHDREEAVGGEGLHQVHGREGRGHHIRMGWAGWGSGC